MEFKELFAKALEIKSLYVARNAQEWGIQEYMQGFVGDVGDLSKLIMAKKGFRNIADVDAKISHELADCLWSVIVLADELGVNLESEFMSSMDNLKKKIETQ